MGEMDVVALRDIGHATTGRTVAIDIETYGAILDKLERQQDHLREKNDIIRAYAGPGGMTPEDVAAALEQGKQWRSLIARMRPLIQHSEREGCPMAFHRSDGEQCTCGASDVWRESRDATDG